MITSVLSFLVSIGGVIGAFLTKEWWIFLVPLGMFILFIAPYKLWKAQHDELTKMKEKRLVVSLSDNYRPRDGSDWLRLRVDNPSGVSIKGCYGKLSYYTMLVSVEGISKKATDISTGASLNDGLPPARHPFPWASTTTPPILKPIGSKDHEFLYIAVVPKQGTNFFTPTESGLGYPKTNIFAEYEAQIDIGSESEEFSPTRVVFRFAMTQHSIEAKELEIVNEQSEIKT